MTSELGYQEILNRLDQVERHLGDRVSRLEVAIMGDEAMGHRGVAGRLEVLELSNSEAPAVHTEIRSELHNAVDAVRDEARASRSEIHGRVDSLWSEWNRVKWLGLGIVAGVSVAGGAGGTWLYNLLA